MAISTFGELKAKLTNTLKHSQWVSQYANATIMFEAAANRRLRVRQMETSTDLTTSSGSVAVPTDYLLWRTVLHTGTNPDIELDYVHPAYLNSTWTESAEGKIFTIEGSTFKARPIDDTADVYEFHYYQKIPSIVGADADAATNWLLTADPDAYFFGVMAELFAIQRNIEGAQLYKARRDETFAEIIQLSALTTGATSPMVRTSEYF